MMRVIHLLGPDGNCANCDAVFPKENDSCYFTPVTAQSAIHRRWWKFGFDNGVKAGAAITTPLIPTALVGAPEWWEPQGVYLRGLLRVVRTPACSCEGIASDSNKRTICEDCQAQLERLLAPRSGK